MPRIVRVLLMLAAVAILVWVLPVRISRQPSIAARPAPAMPDNEVSFRIILGLTDTKSTSWDGSISVTAGTLRHLEPWRFDEDDALNGASGWKLSTHQVRLFGSGPNRPVVANGFVATFGNLTPGSEIRVQTSQGNFAFHPSDLSYGASAKLLAGRVMVDRVPVSTQVTSGVADHDYPAAAADRQGNIWVAYMKFTPNPKFLGIRMAQPTAEAPKDFSDLAEPTGGDQIFLARYSRGAWSEPIAVSDPHGDLYKPAIAVDGSGRVWVFWSSNKDGNFDLYARSLERSVPGKTVRLTTDPGADITPVAATDAQGRVWVAWQAFREGRGQIHAAHQDGTNFSKEMLIASSVSNEWNPAIAASTKGDVTIAWDTYRKGDYDVYMRTIDNEGRLGPERPVAASTRYEAYPSLAYDPAGRLWVAWEESSEGWGKDWGAYKTTGVAVYQSRWIRTKVFDGEKALAPPDVGALLPGFPTPRIDSTARQNDPETGSQPDPELAKSRKPNQASSPPQRPLNSFPRLVADQSGRIWLAYRTPQPIWWTAIGTVWFENVVSFDGSTWSDPIFIPNSSNLLDNRPALTSTVPGELVIVGSSDGRQQFHPNLRLVNVPNQSFLVEKDPYHNQLYSSRILIQQPVQAATLEPAPVPPALTTGTPNPPDVARLRNYRVKINGVEYRLLRGEFHRHSDVSMDGARDGALWDTWRYALDAVALDWIGCCDHDNGLGREYPWWINQKLDDIFLIPSVFTPMFNYERSIAYPEGHRNIIMARRGVRTLPRLPKVDEKTSRSAPDTRMLYAYLQHYDGVVASHTSATGMGTDWRDHDVLREPAVEIYQGLRQNYEMPDAPRSNNPNDSIGGYRPKGFVSLALAKGYKMSFEASSDHVSTHQSYAMLYATDTTREALLDALKKRHVYAATDDILADVRSGDHIVGEEFETSELPTITVKLTGTAPFAKVHIIKDSLYAYTTEPHQAEVEFSWRDTSPQADQTSYYYVRGEQEDGEVVWVSPMWITYRGK